MTTLFSETPALQSKYALIIFDGSERQITPWLGAIISIGMPICTEALTTRRHAA